MTKERLEEIRHRERAEDAVVYTVFENDKTATALYIAPDREDDNELLAAYMSLERVYETKEEAEWYCKMNAERTERFEPPMWEDILIGYMFWFCDNSRKQSILIKFHLSKLSNITIERSDAIGVPIFDEPATKENYEKACEIVRDLFIK